MCADASYREEEVVGGFGPAAKCCFRLYRDSTSLVQPYIVSGFRQPPAASASFRRFSRRDMAFDPTRFRLFTAPRRKDPPAPVAGLAYFSSDMHYIRNQPVMTFLWLRQQLPINYMT
jgi:hypothetical protein